MGYKLNTAQYMKNDIVQAFSGVLKYVAGFAATLVFRLLSPFLGLSNVSPLMATQLAGAKAYGPWVGALYGALSIALLDMLVGSMGSWTLVTGLTQALWESREPIT